MPGELGEDAGPDPVIRIGAAVEVLGKQRLASGMGNEVIIERLELLGRDLAVSLPPHGFFGERIADCVLVLGTAAGMGAGLRTQRSVRDDRSLTERQRMFVEARRFQIPVDRGEVPEAERLSAAGAVPQTRFLHERPPLDAGAAGPPSMPRLWRGWLDYSACPMRARAIVLIKRAAKSIREREFMPVRIDRRS